MKPGTTRSILVVLGLIGPAIIVPVDGHSQSAPTQAADSFDGRLAEVLDRMEVVIAEDRAAAGSGDSLDTASIDALRDSLEALVAAASREGKPPEAVERQFTYAALRRFRRDVPDWLRDANGKLDTSALLASAGLTGGAAQGRRDTGYLSAIQAEGADTRVRPGGDAASGSLSPAGDGARPDAQEPAGEVAAIPADEPAERFVIVQTGDTLTSLALEYYGDMLEYRRIYTANRDVIQNPSLLYPGTRLRLPR